MKFLKALVGLLLLMWIITLPNCKSVEMKYFGLVEQNIGEKEKQDIQSAANDINANQNLATAEIPNTSIIYGILKDTTDQMPLSEILVELLVEDEFIQIVETDSLGQYRFINLNYPQNYTIEILNQNYSTVQQTIEVQDVSEIKLNFLLTKFGKISGKVLNGRNNAPISNTLIFAEDLQGNYYTAVTNESGEYTLTGLIQSTYTISVIDDHYSFTEQTLSVSIGEEKEDLNFRTPSGAIFGTVKNAHSSTPISNTQIHIYKFEQEFEESRTFGKRIIQAEEDGSFYIDGLEKGGYEIQVVSDGYGTKLEFTFILLEGQKIERDFSLYPEGTIGGSLSGLSDTDSLVFVVLDQSKNIIKTKSAISENQKYLISGLEKGTYDVLIHWNNSIRIKSNVHVLEGEKTKSVDFLLGKEFGTVSGIIRSSVDNAPLEGIVIIAYSTTAGNFAISKSDGNYEIQNLEAGVYSLMITNNNGEIITKENISILKNQKTIDVNFLISQN